MASLDRIYFEPAIGLLPKRDIDRERSVITFLGSVLLLEAGRLPGSTEKEQTQTR